jgi:tRNA modification GTPase
LVDYKAAVADVLQEELWELSAHERASVSLLRGEIAARFSQDIAQLGQLTVVTNARHSAALELCSEELQMIIEGIESGLSGDLMSFHLRTGIRALADITGEIDNEEVLGEIFSSFCIGK